MNLKEAIAELKELKLCIIGRSQRIWIDREACEAIDTVVEHCEQKTYTAEETQDFAEWCSLHNWTCYDSKMWLRMYRGERMTGDAKTTAQLRELWERERRGK